MGATFRQVSERARFHSNATSGASVHERESARVPVCVRTDYDEPTEPIEFRGASVRNIRSETDGAEGKAEVSRAGPRFDLRVAGETHTGLRRRPNQDALLMLREQSVFAVADGMGGHAGGQIASQLAIDAIKNAFAEGTVTPCSLMDVPLEAGELVESIGAANEAIRARAGKDLALEDMGTTVVAARFCAEKGRLYVTHVGDSRGYRLRDGKLDQITKDHTMAELGVHGREGDFLSRAVGPKALVEPDVAIIEPRVGDVYLLCTDGLTKMISDEAIREVLTAEERPEEAASALISRANEAGGRDNITAVVLKVIPVAGAFGATVG